MVELLDETIEESELNLTRAGTPNPALVPIVNKIIERLDTGKFTIIKTQDKKEAERTGESIRNQLKARGYRVSKKTAVKIEELKSPKGRVLKDEDGNPLTNTVIMLYMHAYSPTANPEVETSERTNGTPKAKSARSKTPKATAES